jgi:hypothetical protein
MNVLLSEQTATIALTDWFLCPETGSVYCAVRTESSNLNQVNVNQRIKFERKKKWQGLGALKRTDISSWQERRRRIIKTLLDHGLRQNIVMNPNRGFNRCGRGWNLVMPTFGDSYPTHPSVTRGSIGLMRFTEPMGRLSTMLAAKPKRNYPSTFTSPNPYAGRHFHCILCLYVTRTTHRLWSPVQRTSPARCNVYCDALFTLLWD